VEVIVVDRSRHDETRAWLETQRARLAAVLLAPPGESAGAALNRGLSAAHGEWLLLLEAGDRVVGDQVLSEALNWLKRTEAGVAGAEVAYNTGEIAKLRSRVNPLRGEFLPAAATFYRRTLFAENGELDPALDHQERYELHARLWKHRVRFKPVPLRITAAEHPPPFSWNSCREEIRVRHRYFSTWRCLGWDLLSLLHWLRHRIAPSVRSGGRKTR
jgi:GT2 family glycosyltransferase